MFKVRVIPCLDVKDGRVVKGVNFVNLRDAGDPVEAAIAYDAAGADELCFLDITASHENRGIILDVVRRTAEACFMPLTVGGGIRTLDDATRLIQAGAEKVSINSAAVKNPKLLAEIARKFGLPEGQISPKSILSSSLTARRAHNLWLSTRKLSTDLGQSLPSFPTGLDLFYTQFQQGYPQKIRSYQQM